MIHAMADIPFDANDVANLSPKTKIDIFKLSSEYFQTLLGGYSLVYMVRK